MDFCSFLCGISATSCLSICSEKGRNQVLDKLQWATLASLVHYLLVWQHPLLIHDDDLARRPESEVRHPALAQSTGRLAPCGPPALGSLLNRAAPSQVRSAFSVDWRFHWGKSPFTPFLRLSRGRPWQAESVLSSGFPRLFWLGKSCWWGYL